MTELQLSHERVPKICDGLETPLSDRVQEYAVASAKRADFEHTIVGTPNVLAASSLYLASIVCDADLEQSELAETAGVTTNAIRESYHRLAKHEAGMAGEDCSWKSAISELVMEGCENND